jgi:ribosomal protein L37AE/L43A
MKAEILDIAEKLYHNHLTPKVATKLLLRLFDVSSIASSKYDITRCPKCKSTDHTMITGRPYKCMDCGNKWV